MKETEIHTHSYNICHTSKKFENTYWTVTEICVVPPWPGSSGLPRQQVGTVRRVLVKSAIDVLMKISVGLITRWTA